MEEPIPQCGKEQDHTLVVTNLPHGPSPEGGERVLDSLLQQRAREETRIPRDFIEIDPKAQRDKRKAGCVMQYQELVADAGKGAKTYLGTLTTANEQWDPGMIGDFTRNLGKDLDRDGVALRIVWSMENGEEKGRWHYHFVLVMPTGKRMTKERIKRHWPHGFVHLRKHDPERGADAAGYVAKYVAKAVLDKHGKRLPKGARITGCVGLTPEAKDRIRHANLPWDIRKKTTPEDRVMPAKGGGRTARRTGQHWPSQWDFKFIGRKPCLIRKNSPLADELHRLDQHLRKERRNMKKDRLNEAAQRLRHRQRDEQPPQPLPDTVFVNHQTGVRRTWQEIQAAEREGLGAVLALAEPTSAELNERSLNPRTRPPARRP